MLEPVTAGQRCAARELDEVVREHRAAARLLIAAIGRQRHRRPGLEHVDRDVLKREAPPLGQHHLERLLDRHRQRGQLHGGGGAQAPEGPDVHRSAQVHREELRVEPGNRDRELERRSRGVEDVGLEARRHLDDLREPVAEERCAGDRVVAVEIRHRPERRVVGRRPQRRLPRVARPVERARGPVVVESRARADDRQVAVERDRAPEALELHRVGRRDLLHFRPRGPALAVREDHAGVIDPVEIAPAGPDQRPRSVERDGPAERIERLGSFRRERGVLHPRASDAMQERRPARPTERPVMPTIKSLPSRSTELPTLSKFCASSMTGLLTSTHVPPFRSKRYTAPVRSWAGAAITARVPSTSSRMPKFEKSLPSDATSFCVSTNAAPSCSKTYAASAPVAPTMIVAPLIPTDCPKLSWLSPSEAMSFWTSTQSPPCRSKTYAAPAKNARSLFCHAPTTARSPSIATSTPKLSPCSPSAAASSRSHCADAPAVSNIPRPIEMNARMSICRNSLGGTTTSAHG